MPFAVSYTPEPTRCASGPKPGTRILQTWICDESPWAADLWDVGIFNCRTIAGSSTLSAHASGRAADSAHNIVNGRSHPSGIALALWLVENHAALGVQEVISNRRRWDNQTRTWRAYGGVSPHIDHCHWSQNASGARYLTIAQIRAVAPQEGFLAGLTDAEQREVLAKTRENNRLLHELHPFPAEKLNSVGKKDDNGKPAARHLRWAAESLAKLRRL